MVARGALIDEPVDGEFVVLSAGALVEWSGGDGAAMLGVVAPGEGWFGSDASRAWAPERAPSDPGSGVRRFALVASRLLVVTTGPRDDDRAQGHLDAVVLEPMLRRAQRVERRLARALTMGLHDRVLAELQELAATFGHRADGGRRIDLPLTQELIADLTGTARESVNRALRDLSALGLVRRVGRSYVVREPVRGHSDCDSSCAPTSAKRSPSRRTRPARSSAIR